MRLQSKHKHTHTHTHTRVTNVHPTTTLFSLLAPPSVHHPKLDSSCDLTLLNDVRQSLLMDAISCSSATPVSSTAWLRSES